jgi:hypothetical protein
MKLLQIIKYDELIDSLSINETEKKATDILIETKAAGLPVTTGIYYFLVFSKYSTMKCLQNLHDCYWL